ncbi:GNAT family N-acetyltransferase [Marinihelvus fidelis]|uniref:GNAT family N-acetyltransferase n=1 Tax=Marinihelvus fidelis TaxID=2613842 RepID=A0A5N0TGG0_9GAMM|nr:GNAT family N-acetyltransferase [Marinihelvus fidelis]KAA9134142.1 GNAT family N-acetyltransferase [Marinihelvus fidelis]
MNNVREETSIEACRDLWNAFSPNAHAWDDWDLMYAFHDQENYDFHFLVHSTDGVDDGLVPLVRDNRDGSYELFGGSYPDARVLWIQPAHFGDFYAAFPDRTDLFDLKGAFVEELLAACPQFEPNFTEVDQRYYLEPKAFDYDFNNHIQTFSSEKRKGFLYDLRKVRERNLDLRWSEDDETDLFIKLVNRNFGDESDYAKPSGQAELHRVISDLKESGWLRTLTIAVDGEMQAVSMSAHFGQNWIALYASSNNDIKNLGKLLNVETIQEASRRGVDEISYMTGMAWKAAWKMSAEACRTMRKPARPPVTPVEATPAG